MGRWNVLVWDDLDGGVLILGIVALVRWLRRGEGERGPDREESALEILKRRYAKGEIDKAEFEEKKRDLMG